MKKQSKVKTALKILGLGVILASSGVALYPKPAPNYNLLFKRSSFRVESSNGSGTAFFVRDGRNNKVSLVTAKHVCVGIASETGIHLIGGIYPTEVFIEKTDPNNDLCTMTFPEYLLTTGITPLELSETSPRIFERVIVGGFPGTLNLVVNEGYYSGPLPTYQRVKDADEPEECTEKGLKPFLKGPFGGIVCASELILPSMTAKVYPGHSGSAVINKDGAVIGVAIMTSTPSYNGILVGLRELRSFLNE